MLSVSLLLFARPTLTIYPQFRSLRKIRDREGIDRSASTPKSLARDYDGRYGFDFESGMGVDLYSQLPIAVGERTSSAR